MKNKEWYISEMIYYKQLSNQFRYALLTETDVDVEHLTESVRKLCEVEQ